MLLSENLTPLLRKQIKHAIVLYEAALDHPESYTTILDDLHNQIKEHWSKLCGDVSFKANLSFDICSFHLFLTQLLVDEYLNEPRTFDPTKGWFAA
jgi:hypothetical protein